MTDLSEVSLVVVFTNFNGYTAQVSRLEDTEVARVMDAWYERAGAAVAAAGGRVVKFIGDAMLATFPDEAADQGVRAVLELKDASDQYMKDNNWDCRLVAKIHYGPVVVAQFGSRADKRYDVLGKTVNVTARLESGGVSLSAEAFRRLNPETRKLFKKHTPPVTYIRLEDSHHQRRR